MDHRESTVRRGQQGDGFDQPLEGTVQRPDHDPVARFRYDALTVVLSGKLLNPAAEDPA